MSVFKATFFLLSIYLLSACGGSSDSATNDNVDVDVGAPDNDNLGPGLASGGCQNVVIVGEFAYAACGDEIEVAALVTGERALISLPANDIAADADANLLFTQEDSTLYMIDVSELPLIKRTN